MIGFDVDFSARSDPAGDKEFGKALRTFQPVILPVFEQAASDGSRGQMLKNRPAPEFGGAWIGGVNIIPGRDGVVRNFPAATLINGQIQPAMAVLLSDNDSLGDRTFIPDWSIDARRIPRFSFIDVLNHRIPAKAIVGKRLIVGGTAIEMGDRYIVPRFGTVPGVVIQALAAESLLQHRALTRTGLIPTAIGLLFVGLLLLGNFERFGRTFPIAAAGFLSLVLGLPLLVQARWPLSLDTAPLIPTAIAAIILRVILEVRHRLRIAAIHDPRTGLPNDRALVAILEEQRDAKVALTAAAIERFDAMRTALPLADVEEVVLEAALRIERIIDRKVHRVAPDTLAWLTSAPDDPENKCAEVAEGFTTAVEIARGPIDVAWTFGLAAIVRGVTPEQMLERALSAITDARKSGRQRHWFQGIATNALRDLSIMGELRRGIDAGELFVAYQPKLDLKSGKIMQAEALVRWLHPNEGIVSPERFITLAEETGVVRDITRYMIGRVIRDCLAARKKGAAIAVSVNVSAADLEHPGFAEEVIGMLSRVDLDPATLTLEVTESAIIRSKEAVRQVLIKLREHGLRLSVDDYGTGQSTLSYLKTLPVHELKIDKSFVTSLLESDGDRIMVRSTIELAHALGLTVVAEGVEDWATVKALTQLGCDYAQGYLVGRAMPLEDLVAMTVTKLRDAA